MIIACNHIEKSFIETRILQDVTFHIEENEKIALVGNNGAGKTTLFKIIAKELSYDSGNVFYSKNCSIGYLKQDMVLKSNETVYDELIHVFDKVIALEEALHTMELEIARTSSLDLIHAYDDLRMTFEKSKGYEYKSLVKGILKGLGFTPDVYTQSIGTLSGGQKTRVALAKLLLEQPDILLLDEPTNHLDIAAIEWLEDFLRSYKGAVILISHDRYFLDKVVTKVIQLEFGKSAVYHGNYSYFVIESAKAYESAMREYTKQQQEIARQKAVIAKLRQFNREKSIKRAESREKMLEKQTPLDVPMIDDKPMNLVLAPAITSGNDVLTVSHLTHAFNDKPLFTDLSFDIKKGDKVAIVGPNGVGKTTLFRIILNKLAPCSGEAILGSKVSIGYYDQEHMTLDMGSTIFDEIHNTFPQMTNGHIRSVLAAFLFTGEDVFKPISLLSGGERGRVALSKIMLSKANFLILDEPTNHLDILSKEVLENALTHYEGTILYVSHDRYFINQTANKILEMQADHITTYLGDYDYYLEKRKEMPISTLLTPLTNETSTKDNWQKQKEFQTKLKKIKTSITKIEEAITEKEDLIVLLDEKLCDSTIYSDFDKSKALMEEKDSLHAEISVLYTEWEALHETLSEFEA